MRKLLTILLMITGLSTVANVTLFANNPWPECYPCPNDPPNK